MIDVKELSPEYFSDVITLGNQVHGDTYLDQQSIEAIYKKGIKDGLNASLLAYKDGKLVGFRLTYAPGHWQLDQWCTPEQWQVPVEQVCYFKCSAVDESLRGLGIAKTLLNASIARAKQQGATAGIAHIWRQSPKNSAFMYFSKCGGELVKDHPGKWDWNCVHEGYICPICGERCKCVAAEMILRF